MFENFESGVELPKFCRGKTTLKSDFPSHPRQITNVFGESHYIPLKSRWCPGTRPEGWYQVFSLSSNFLSPINYRVGGGAVSFPSSWVSLAPHSLTPLFFFFENRANETLLELMFLVLPRYAEKEQPAMDQERRSMWWHLYRGRILEDKKENVRPPGAENVHSPNPGDFMVLHLTYIRAVCPLLRCRSDSNKRILWKRVWTVEVCPFSVSSSFEYSRKLC